MVPVTEISRLVGGFSAVIWLLILHAGVADGIQVRFNPKDTEAYPGSTTTLECIFDVGTPQCSWIKDGEILADGMRYSRKSASTGDCTLTITSVSILHDDGVWQCQNPATSEIPATKTTSARLTVLVAPSSPVIRYRNQDQAAGAQIPLEAVGFTLSCVSEGGNPPAKLQWIVDGRELIGNVTITNYTNVQWPEQAKLQNTVNVLYVNDTNILTNKQLKCVAEHRAFNNTKPEAYVFTRTAGPTSIVDAAINGTDSDTLQVSSGTEVTLTCNGDGFPIPEYLWERRDTDSSTWQNIGYGEVQEVQVTKPGVYRCSTTDSQSSNPIRSRELRINVPVANEANAGAIAGIVVACVVIVGALAATIFILYRKRKWIFTPKKQQREEEIADTDSSKPLKSSSTRRQWFKRKEKQSESDDEGENNDKKAAPKSRKWFKGTKKPSESDDENDEDEEPEQEEEKKPKKRSKKRNSKRDSSAEANRLSSISEDDNNADSPLPNGDSRNSREVEYIQVELPPTQTKKINGAAPKSDYAELRHGEHQV